MTDITTATTMTPSDIIVSSAPKILDIIKSSNNILLHCHPAPDPDSVGSALAMKFALEQMGKKVTVIRGDGPMPDDFAHFPGFGDIVNKNFLELDLTGATGNAPSTTATPFDLFIVLDSSSPQRVTSIGPITIPETLKIVIIDHHMSNTGDFGRADTDSANIILPSYPATSLILFKLFKLWNVRLTSDIAANLFIGMYTDTGGFKYAGVTSDVFTAAAELASVCPDFHQMIFKMENNRRPAELAFQGLAFSNIKTFLGERGSEHGSGHLAISAVSFDELEKHGIHAADTSASLIANIVKSVVGWDVGACLVETEKGLCKVSFRTRDPATYDLSLIAGKLGGGGHKSAAAAVVHGSIDEVMKKIVDAVRDSMV